MEDIRFEGTASLTATRARAPLFPKSAFDLLVIGASAGGISALKSIIKGLPIALPCAVAIVQHIPEFAFSQLASVLGWGTRLITQFAADGQRLRAGTVYVAPPGAHLVISPDRRFSLEKSPRVHYVRPSADLLFRSAASAFGPRVLGLVLSGMGRDSAAGAAAVKRAGGVIIVQDPNSAEAPSMPLAASKECSVDLTLPVSAIPGALLSLCEVQGARALFCASKLDQASCAGSLRINSV
jgi:two-component system chemotaxis response regulator CheB